LERRAEAVEKCGAGGGGGVEDVGVGDVGEGRYDVFERLYTP
jgi:hypothetical protein